MRKMREQRRERRWSAETREQTHSQNIITGATGANPLKKKHHWSNRTKSIQKNERDERAETREKMESRDERKRRTQTK